MPVASIRWGHKVTFAFHFPNLRRNIERCKQININTQVTINAQDQKESYGGLPDQHLLRDTGQTPDICRSLGI